MQKDAVAQDQQHEFTGVTIGVISIQKLKTQMDGGQLFVRVKCHDKIGQTRRKLNDRDLIVFDQHFFYNTTEIIDDDISFQLYEAHHDHGASKALLSSSKIDRSKLNDVGGRLLGASKPIQVSRLPKKSPPGFFDLFSDQNKVVAKIKTSFDYLQRQDIIGGIKPPNLSLRPDKDIKSPLTLENKYAASKNLYSFLDGNTTPFCEFFPKKFRH